MNKRGVFAKASEPGFFFGFGECSYVLLGAWYECSCGDCHGMKTLAHVRPRGSSHSTMMEVGPQNHTLHGFATLTPSWYYKWTFWVLVPRGMANPSLDAILL